MKRGYYYLILAALSFGSMSTLIKLLSADLGSFWMPFLYMLVSFGIMAVITKRKKQPLRLKQRKDYATMIAMGVFGYAFQVMFFTSALYHTTIGNALFVFSCYPIIAAVLAFFFLKEKINKQMRVALVLLFCVLFLLFDPSTISSQYLLGNSYALLACILNAGYIIGSRVLSKTGNAPETITLWSMGLAVLTTGTAALALQSAPSSLSMSTILYLVLFGILNVAAWHFMNKGFAKVKAGTGSIILLLEPVIGSLLGLMLFREVPTLTFVVGAVVMMTTVYIATSRLD